MSKQKMPVLSIVILLLIFGGMLFITVEAIKSTFWSIFIALAAFMVGVGIFFRFVGVDLPFLAKPKKFISLDGISGICVSALNDEGWGLSSIQIAVKKKYVPESLQKPRGNLRSAMLWIGGAVMVSVTADSDLFVDIPAKNCLIPQGCIFLMGSIDTDKKIINTVDYPLQNLKSLLEEKNALTREVNTRMISALSQAAINSRVTKEDLIENLRSIMPIMQQMIQAKQPQEQRITIGTGGG